MADFTPARASSANFNRLVTSTQPKLPFSSQSKRKRPPNVRDIGLCTSVISTIVRDDYSTSVQSIETDLQQALETKHITKRIARSGNLVVTSPSQFFLFDTRTKQLLYKIRTAAAKDRDFWGFLQTTPQSHTIIQASRSGIIDVSTSTLNGWSAVPKTSSFSIRLDDRDEVTTLYCEDCMAVLGTRLGHLYLIKVPKSGSSPSIENLFCSRILKSRTNLMTAVARLSFGLISSNVEKDSTPIKQIFPVGQEHLLVNHDDHISIWNNWRIEGELVHSFSLNSVISKYYHNRSVTICDVCEFPIEGGAKQSVTLLVLAMFKPENNNNNNNNLMQLEVLIVNVPLSLPQDASEGTQQDSSALVQVRLTVSVTTLTTNGSNRIESSPRLFLCPNHKVFVVFPSFDDNDVFVADMVFDSNVLSHILDSNQQQSSQGLSIRCSYLVHAKVSCLQIRHMTVLPDTDGIAFLNDLDQVVIIRGQNTHLYLSRVTWKASDRWSLLPTCDTSLLLDVVAKLAMKEVSVKELTSFVLQDLKSLPDYDKRTILVEKSAEIARSHDHGSIAGSGVMEDSAQAINKSAERFAFILIKHERFLQGVEAILDSVIDSADISEVYANHQSIAALVAFFEAYADFHEYFIQRRGMDFASGSSGNSVRITRDSCHSFRSLVSYAVCEAMVMAASHREKTDMHRLALQEGEEGNRGLNSHNNSNSGFVEELSPNKRQGMMHLTRMEKFFANTTDAFSCINLVCEVLQTHSTISDDLRIYAMYGVLFEAGERVLRRCVDSPGGQRPQTAAVCQGVRKLASNLSMPWLRLLSRRRVQEGGDHLEWAPNQGFWSVFRLVGHDGNRSDGDSMLSCNEDKMYYVMDEVLRGFQIEYKERSQQEHWNESDWSQHMPSEWIAWYIDMQKWFIGILLELDMFESAKSLSMKYENFEGILLSCFKSHRHSEYYAMMRSLHSNINNNNNNNNTDNTALESEISNNVEVFEKGVSEIKEVLQLQHESFANRFGLFALQFLESKSPKPKYILEVGEHCKTAMQEFIKTRPFFGMMKHMKDGNFHSAAHSALRTCLPEEVFDPHVRLQGVNSRTLLSLAKLSSHVSEPRDAQMCMAIDKGLFNVTVQTIMEQSFNDIFNDISDYRRGETVMSIAELCQRLEDTLFAILQDSDSNDLSSDLNVDNSGYVRQFLIAFSMLSELLRSVESGVNGVFERNKIMERVQRLWMLSITAQWNIWVQLANNADCNIIDSGIGNNVRSTLFARLLIDLHSELSSDRSEVLRYYQLSNNEDAERHALVIPRAFSPVFGTFEVSLMQQIRDGLNQLTSSDSNITDMAMRLLNDLLEEQKAKTDME